MFSSIARARENIERSDKRTERMRYMWDVVIWCRHQAGYSLRDENKEGEKIECFLYGFYFLLP
jgi:ribosomal protein RSM22 (predicted rRNA methylase)